MKTGAGETVVSSSLTASAENTRPWCNGSMAGSNPVGQGSSPWGRAIEQTFARKMGSSSNRKMPVSQAGDPGAIPGWVHSTTWSCGLVAKAALLQGADRGFESLQDYSMPGYANRQSDPA